MNLTCFTAGAEGEWRVRSVTPVRGEGLAAAPRLVAGDERHGAWTLRGQPSNVRYAARSEVTALRAVQQGLGRDHATCAALIPIRKSDAWWALAQDERLDIFTAQSRHNAIGLDYLPAVARQLYHSRDHGEPFDFLTWFEYAPEAEAEFNALLARLRATPEWGYVEREVDVRLERVTG